MAKSVRHVLDFERADERELHQLGKCLRGGGAVKGKRREEGKNKGEGREAGRGRGGLG